MSTRHEGYLPGYEELKQEYPEEIESIEQGMGLYRKIADLDEIFSNDKVPEIVSDAEKLDLEEIVEKYEQSLVFELMDYGLINNDLDNVTVTVGGENYLRIIENLREQNEIPKRDYSHIWTPESELEKSFGRYENDLETIRNVFEGIDSPEKHIRWDELPEPPEEFPEDPDWFEARATDDIRGPDWISILK